MTAKKAESPMKRHSELSLGSTVTNITLPATAVRVLTT
jgi:hypothetical protein